MSDALTPAEVVSQHVELLPARTVLSTLTTDSSVGTNGSSGANSVGTPTINILGVPFSLVPGFGH
ncbi:MAG: hypothetical protein ACRDRX_11770 [Pseudonocardiaceae bacterium]